MIFKKTLKKLSNFEWNLFFALCIVSLFPSLYQMIRTYLVSTTTSQNAFDIIGQMEWFDLINETLQAFLIIPLYSVFNKIINGKKIETVIEKKELPKNIFYLGIIIFFIYFLFSLIIFIYGKHLISLMNPAQIDLERVNQYLRLETLAFIVGIINSFVNVVLIVMGKAKNVYIMLLINCLLLILSDILLIPNLGINGIAFSNLCVNILMAIAGIIILIVNKYIVFSKYEKNFLINMRYWIKNGIFSGTQVFIDNLIYAIMICKMVNTVAEQGNYWNANNFIWGWLLIPISSLSEIIKKNCKNGYTNLNKSNYYSITLIVLGIWIVTIPIWKIYFKYFNKLENYLDVYMITLKLFPFYIAYALSSIPDNIFIGIGKIKYNVINSIIINFIYYGIFYCLYKCNIIVMNMNTIIIMFGFGMVFHMIISFIEDMCLKKSIKKNNFEIKTTTN